jgi:AraC-like DNA-binding protein
LAKIAVALERALAHRRAHGSRGETTPRVIARGGGWTVADVICTRGPQDRPYEERHARDAIALVLAGNFQYRTSAGSGLMTAGSLLLGNHEDGFECAHEHGEGDRCVSLWYDPDYFERLAADAGARRTDRRFNRSRLPPLRQLSAIAARAGAAVHQADAAAWEEIAVTLAARAVTVSAGLPSDHNGLPPNAESRVARAIRAIDRQPDAAPALGSLAQAAGLSPYHFLRTFTRVIGVTPHQYVRRGRLRYAASRLGTDGASVLDIALDSGFGDVSNFNRAFRAEFGVSPGVLRRTLLK